MELKPLQIDMQLLQAWLQDVATMAIDWATSPALYSQLGLALLALVLSWGLSGALRRHSAIFAEAPKAGPLKFLRKRLYAIREMLFPLLLVLLLSVAVDVSEWFAGSSTVVRIFEGLAVVWVIYNLIVRFISNYFVRSLIKWVVIPVAVMQVFGVLDDAVGYLESLYVQIGNIRISAYGIVRVIFFGAILFWLGRISNNTGQRIIRQQTDLDIGTREVIAKLYQVILILVIFILLLQIMGINITALAVFGGALGVGLGFGLQSIASNFISGMILLLDRSLAVGDYIELDDGRKGTIRELNMRSTKLETFDGKDIMVPNEQFISSKFVNWTHQNKKQRYSIEFQVAYSTDLHKLFSILREVVASHPQVLSGDDLPIEERPDAEICGFGDSGVDILVEFWMAGIDDGENRVGGDLYLMIWDALKEHGIEIPFPQREVKILSGKITESDGDTPQ